MSGMTFEALLEEIDTLPEERQETLMEIVRHRLADRRRKEMAGNAQEARSLFEKGQLPRGSVEDLMQGLDDDGQSEDCILVTELPPGEGLADRGFTKRQRRASQTAGADFVKY